MTWEKKKKKGDTGDTGDTGVIPLALGSVLKGAVGFKVEIRGCWGCIAYASRDDVASYTYKLH